MVQIDHLDLDLDRREAEIRARIYEQRDFWAEAPENPAAIIATYFIHARHGSLREAGESISYHMTSAVKNPPPGSLLERCTGQLADVLAWTPNEKIGLVRVAFPLKMFEREDGKYYTTDFLHIAAGAGVLALWDFAAARLVDVNIPDAVLATFPGPAYGCHGARELTNWPQDEPAFGTILKPTAGITDQEVAKIVEGVAGERLFMFVKEDENLLPHLPYCYVTERARKSMAVIRSLADQRGDRGLIFCPHVTAPPNLLMETVERVLETGVNGIMFSEQYIGGGVRAVREMTQSMSRPPVIYGHNGGISCRTMSIWREVLDLFARLDGIDFRQTAPLTLGAPLLRPQGLEWRKCEEVLSRPMGPIKPVMVTRAGGLDQGNIILNLTDAAERLPRGQGLFLAGSAINSIKGANGKADSRLGVEAMHEAVSLWKMNCAPDARQEGSEYIKELYTLAQSQRMSALMRSLEQRYPHEGCVQGAV